MIHTKFSRIPFEKSFNNLVDDLFSELPVILKTDAPFQQRNNYVAANITEKENSYALEIVAPGFEKNDFKINLEQNILTVSAEKKTAEKTNTEKQIRNEYQFRSFKRAFTLDDKIDASSIEATYVNGVLTLNLLKKETVKQSVQEITIS